MATSIYDLSWSETSFRSKLKLFSQSRKREKKRMRSGDTRVQVKGYSALSSTYYSIVGTAFSQLKAALRPKLLAPVKVAAWCLTWFPLAAYCYWRMLPLSNRALELAGGYEGLSADQCDVRQSVLRRRGQYEEAKKCIRAALAKNPEKAHTRGLLLIGLVEIYLETSEEAVLGEMIKAVLVEAKKSETEDPRQAARIYRHLANFTLMINSADLNGKKDRFRKKAQELAVSADARDQLLKQG